MVDSAVKERVYNAVRDPGGLTEVEIHYRTPDQWEEVHDAIEELCESGAIKRFYGETRGRAATYYEATEEIVGPEDDWMCDDEDVECTSEDDDMVLDLEPAAPSSEQLQKFIDIMLEYLKLQE